MINRSRLLRSTILGGVLSFAVAAPGWAQTAQVQDATPAPADTEAVQQSQQTTQPNGTRIEDVIVTGSRIRRDDFNSASPIQVITKEVSTQAGLVSTAEIVQGSTVAQGSTQVNSLFSGFITDGGPGIQSVSLRGLGANRTLVLLNGRRLAPAGAGGTTGAAADLNVLPSGILQRVEILKDGASSVYGSDAVAGVVNAITVTNFDGVQFGVTRSMTQDGGGAQTSADVVWGKQFDRGNLLIAAEYQNQERLRYSDRDWAQCGYDNVREPFTGRDLDYRNADGSKKCVGGTWHGFIITPFGYVEPDAGSLGFVDLGGALPGFPGLPGYRDLRVDDYGTGGVDETSYEGPFDDERSLIFPTELFTTSAFFNYDLTGNVEAYAELLYNNRQSSQVTAGQFFPQVDFTDPRNPLAPLVGAIPNGFISAQPVAPIRYEDSQEVNYVRGVAGLRGDLTSGPLSAWSWDLYYQYSKSDADYGGSRLLADRVANALEVAPAPGGGYQCADPAARAAGCVPLPIFENRFLKNGQLTEAERNYVYSEERGSTQFTSHLINGSITGDLFEIPAGTVAGAFGFEVRRDEINDQPSANSRIGNVYGYSSAGVTQGTEKVYEVFGEVEAPILNNIRFVEDLTANASARYTKYSETGFEDTTYKVGLNWTVTPQFRLRSTYGTSFRAPALYELFLGSESGFYTGADPCNNFGARVATSNLYINCRSELGAPVAGRPYASRSTPEIFTFGARNRPPAGPFSEELTAETSNAFTAGLVWTPGFSNLSIALDYFQIEVNGEIAALSAGSILSQCYNLRPDEFRDAGTICDLVAPRTAYNPATNVGGEIAFINTSYFNIDSQRTGGFDLTTRFTKDFSFGEFAFDTRTTLTTLDKVDVLGGRERDFNGTIGDPELVSDWDFRLERGDWTYFWRMSYVSQTEDYSLYAAPNNQELTSLYDLQVDASLRHTVSVTYEGDTWQATAGINNVFDEWPDSVSSAITRIGDAGFNSQLDPFGRTFFVSLRKTFQ